MELIILRHGQTEWTLTGQHTGTTNVELTEAGREEARRREPALRRLLDHRQPSIYVSPLLRAVQTAELALPDMSFHVEPLIREFNYGLYEGMTSAEIEQFSPGWDIWRDGCPEGETTSEVAARADDFLDTRVFSSEQPVIAVSHGHFSRALAIRALGRPVAEASIFSISTASISVIKSDRGRIRLSLWNYTSSL